MASIVKTVDPDQESIRLLRAADMEQLMELKDAANWNQVPADWERLLALAPGGCFGLFAGNRLAATATAIAYGRELAWIGMVLTLPEFRGRGYASRLMECCLEYLKAAGVAQVKLDATNLGIEIYRRFGFQDECPVERWERHPAPFEAGSARERFPRQWPPALDRQAFGADRSALLASLEQTGSLAGCDDGYAMSRDGSRAAYLGPCAARDPDTARALLAALLAPIAGGAVYWDLLPDNAGAAAIAREFGFEPARRLTRMHRLLLPGSAGVRPDNSLVYAIAGLEVG